MPYLSIKITLRTLCSMSLIFGLVSKNSEANSGAKVSLEAIETCMNKTSSDRDTVFKADERRFQGTGNASATRKFKGGDEFETILFFKCRGIELSGKFNKQGVFSSSEAMSGLKYLRSIWTDSFWITKIDVNSLGNYLTFSEKNGFALNISDRVGRHLNNASLLLKNTDPESSILVALHNANIPGVEEIKWDGERFKTIQALYSNSAFKYQGGIVTTIKNRKSGVHDNNVEIKDGEATILLSRSAPRQGELRVMSKWLSNSRELFSALSELKIDFSKDPIYEKHWTVFERLLSLKRKDPNIFESFVVGGFIGGFASAIGNSYSYAEVETRKGQSIARVFLGTNIKTSVSVFDPGLLEIHDYFISLDVKIPQKISWPTFKSLVIIGQSWNQRLRLKEIRLHSSANEIETKGGVLRRKFNVISLNPNETFNGYTELVQDFYID